MVFCMRLLVLHLALHGSASGSCSVFGENKVMGSTKKGESPAKGLQALVEGLKYLHHTKLINETLIAEQEIGLQP